jgi:Sigma-70 factor, region 1.1
MLKNECPETLLLDLSDAAVKELIRNAKKRGYVTHDQINDHLMKANQGCGEAAIGRARHSLE